MPTLHVDELSKLISEKNPREKATDDWADAETGEIYIEPGDEFGQTRLHKQHQQWRQENYQKVIDEYSDPTIPSDELADVFRGTGSSQSITLAALANPNLPLDDDDVKEHLGWYGDSAQALAVLRNPALQLALMSGVKVLFGSQMLLGMCSNVSKLSPQECSYVIKFCHDVIFAFIVDGSVNTDALDIDFARVMLPVAKKSESYETYAECVAELLKPHDDLKTLRSLWEEIDRRLNEQEAKQLKSLILTKQQQEALFYGQFCAS